MALLTRRADVPYMPLREAMNQLFADAFAPMAGPGVAATEGSGLPVNIYEDDERYYLQVQAPGANAEAVEITAAEGALSLSIRQEPVQKEGWKQLWQEFSPTEFRRQIRLPMDFDADGIEASYVNGVMLVTVPKAAHTRPRTIKVKVG